MSEIQWRIQVYLCRRFMKKLTVDKLAVLAHVTGAEPAAILRMHAGARESTPPSQYADVAA